MISKDRLACGQYSRRTTDRREEMLRLGKKLASASFTVFCAPDELRDWIRTLCIEKNLACVSFIGANQFSAIEEAPDEIMSQDDNYHRIFLCPKSSSPKQSLGMNDVQPLAWGWV